MTRTELGASCSARAASWEQPLPQIKGESSGVLHLRSGTLEEAEPTALSLAQAVCGHSPLFHDLGLKTSFLPSLSKILRSFNA